MQSLLVRFLCVLFLAMGLLAPGLAQAQILDDLEVKKRNGDYILSAKFSTIVRYEKHVLAKSGTSLIVYLRVVGLAKGKEIKGVRRISKRPRLNGAVPFVDMTYNGNFKGGPRLIVRFSKKLDYRVRQGRDNRSIDIIIPSQRSGKSSRKSTGSLSKAQQAEAKGLMQQGRKALKRNKNVAAIRAFSKLLKLPEGPLTEEAHELLGLARERNGQRKLALVEYKLYLKLYSSGEGAERVRQRLLILERSKRPKALRAPKQKQSVDRAQLYGTFSQIYYRGNSVIDTSTQIGPTLVEQPTLSDVDQSALISNLDVTGRYRTESFDTRAVVSADYDHDFLDDEAESSVRSAYLDIKNRPHRYSARLGRQSGTSGGILGRFDGIFAGYNVLSKWRVNAFAGEPDDTIAPDSERLFSGGSVDFGTFAGAWSGSLYYFGQTIDELTDRRAVGAELRYFDSRGSVFGLVDHDLFFNKLNIFLIQGNWQSKHKTTYNLLLDYRRNPPLQLSNALLGETAQSINELLQTNTKQEIKQFAEDRTSTSRVISAGVLQPLSKRFEFGLDVTFTEVSDLPASGTLPATEGTGDVFTYAVKLIGNSLLLKRDVAVLGAAYTESELFDATSAYLTDRLWFNNRWRLDLGFKWYQQLNSNDTELTRLTPSLEINYRWDTVSFELEYGREQTHTENAMLQEDVKRDFYAIGYRWDF